MDQSWSRYITWYAYLIAFRPLLKVEITGGFDRNFMAVTKLRPTIEYYLLDSSSSKFQDILTSRNTVIDVYMYFLFHLKCRWTRLPSNNKLPWVKVTVNVRALEVLCNKTLHRQAIATDPASVFEIWGSAMYCMYFCGSPLSLLWSFLNPTNSTAFISTMSYWNPACQNKKIRNTYYGGPRLSSSEEAN